MSLTHTIIIILVAIIIFLIWRTYALKKRIHSLTTTIRNTTKEKLPQDLPHLDNLSNAIAALQKRLLAEVDEAKAEQSKLSNILEQIPDGILIANKENRIEFANPAARNLLNKETNEMVGSTVSESV